MVPPLTVAQSATLACVLEVSTPKPGNVHRGADFAEESFYQFAGAAALIGEPMERAVKDGVGAAVLEAAILTRDYIGTNTNLGTLLLIAPLAAVPRAERLRRETVGRVLSDLTQTDTRNVYRAINVAQPGGLGKAEQADVADAPPANLREAMRLAQDRDQIARQYVEDFALILDTAAPRLLENVRRHRHLTPAIVDLFLQLLADYPDSLIARKCGAETARHASDQAAAVLCAENVGERSRRITDLDFWLRSDGHRRNPGTTADLVAATLFVVLRDGQIAPPFPLRTHAPATPAEDG